MVGKEGPSLLCLPLLAAQSDVLLLVAFHPGCFGAEFGLDEEALIEVVFFLCLMQDPCDALLDGRLLGRLLLAREIFIHPLGVTQGILEEAFVALLLEERRLVEVGEGHGGLAGGLGEGQFGGDGGAPNHGLASGGW